VVEVKRPRLNLVFEDTADAADLFALQKYKASYTG